MALGLSEGSSPNVTRQTLPVRFASCQTGSLLPDRRRPSPPARAGDAGAAIVMRVHADADLAAAGEVAAKILDLIGIDVGGVDFHRRRQIDDHRSLGAGLPDIRHRFANLKRKLGLGEAEGFRRIFILPAGLRLLFALLTDKPGGAGREGDHLGLVHAENQLAEQRRGGIVEVDG